MYVHIMYCIRRARVAQRVR